MARDTVDGATRASVAIILIVGRPGRTAGGLGVTRNPLGSDG
jgi:hypothetical protein